MNTLNRMCAEAGSVKYSKKSVTSETQATATALSMSYRGPDGGGMGGKQHRLGAAYVPAAAPSVLQV